MSDTPRSSVSRREFVHLSAIGGAGLGLAPLAPGGFDWLSRVSRDAAPVDVARAAAEWLRQHAVRTPAGITWPRVPGEDEGGDVGLYHGAPGPILFLLELAHQTRDRAALQEAAGGARELVAALDRDDPIEPGLYSGLAGMAYTLDLAADAAGDATFGHAARVCIDRIIESARTLDTGVAWFEDDPANASSDIVSGAAGIGFTLLWYAERHGHDRAVYTAIDAARHLASLGETAPVGRKWKMMPSFERLMPNFSHGTAGIAAFLARAHTAGGGNDLLDAAVDGGRYLKSIAVCGEGGCRVFHHEPEGEDLFYLSWCHGPPGTARLFYQLTRSTGDDEWAEWLEKGAGAIHAYGVPQTRSDGYWNNISQCCGDCGVGEYFLALHAMTGKAEHLEFARRIADHVQGRSDAPEAEAQAWTQAEHRVRPDLLEAQTGWMQGAAGVGAFFLHLDARARGRSPLVSLPDTPWAAEL